MDTTGRLVIPTKLRNRLGMVIGQMYHFYTMEDEAGRRFICIECPDPDEKTLSEARHIVETYGME